MRYAIASLVLAALVACGAQSVTTTAAQAVYGGQLDQCARETPAPDPDAGVEGRRAAWAAFDACTHRVAVAWAPLSGRDAGTLDSGKDGSP